MKQSRRWRGWAMTRRDGPTRRVAITSPTRGPPPLSHYLQSVDVTTTDADQHLTLVGHSYGSLTSGLALQHRANAVVDDYCAPRDLPRTPSCATKQRSDRWPMTSHRS